MEGVGKRSTVLFLAHFFFKLPSVTTNGFASKLKWVSENIYVTHSMFSILLYRFTLLEFKPQKSVHIYMYWHSLKQLEMSHQW